MFKLSPAYHWYPKKNDKGGYDDGNCVETVLRCRGQSALQHVKPGLPVLDKINELSLK